MTHPARIRTTPDSRTSRQCVTFRARSKGVPTWKVRIMSPAQAIRIANQHDAELNVYRCGTCGYVHAGNPKVKPEPVSGTSKLGKLAPQLKAIAT